MTPIYPLRVTNRDVQRQRCLAMAVAAFVLGMSVHAFISPTRAVEIKRDMPVVAGPLCTVGQSLCQPNNGMARIHPLGNSRYTFECRDGAEFRNLEATFVEDGR